MKQYDFSTNFWQKADEKEKAEKLGIPLELVRRNAEKESEKTFTKVDMNGLLHDFVAVMPYEKTTFVDKVGYQINDLGYVDIVSQDYKGYVVVMDVETKYTPKLKVYALANGNTITVKIAKKDFNKNPLQVGDVVRVNDQKKKQG